MSLEREQPARVAAAEAERQCVGCDQPVEGPRCTWCGVAVAPGGFTVERVLAQGPRGRVYRARDSQGRLVALKELQFATVPEVKEVDAFEREAATLRTLSHPAIPRFISSFSEGSGVHLRLYLAAELVEGEPLSARLAHRPLVEPELYSVAFQVLEVLEYLHGQEPPVLHRDIKPENLLVRPDGRLAVVDFGSARWLHSGPRTFGSTLVGTFGYMPPEQLGGTVDVTSDLYALGATLLHAATGRPPSELLVEGLRLHLPESVPAPLRRVLEQVLAPIPEHRLPNTQALRHALEESRDPARGERRWRTQVVAALGLGLSVVLAGAVFLLSEPPARAPATVHAPLTAPVGQPAPAQTSAQEWFARARAHCNPVEVSRYMASSPPVPGWEGSGYAAGCYALAGKVEPARELLLKLPEGRRPQAAGIVFNLGHGVADSGDDVAAAPIMDLVLDFWPDNYMALYHAGMSDHALGRPERARERLRRFLELYRASDSDFFRRQALEALQRMEQGLPPATPSPGAH